MKRCVAAAALGLAACGAGDGALAGSLFTGQFGTGNTWNVYEAINSSYTFKDALAFAATRENPIAGNTTVGNLVALTTQEENDFVQLNASGNRWIGLTDRAGVAPGASEGNFRWVTGEDPTLSFSAWGSGEPNNSTEEDATHLRGDSMWNDHKSGFRENDPSPDFDSGDETTIGGGYMGFVIEWRTNLASMPTGFPSSRPDPPNGPLPPIGRVFPTPLARLAGPNGTATAWGTREVLYDSPFVDTRDAVNRLLDTTMPGTEVTGTLPRIDVIDPATNAGTLGTVDSVDEVDFVGGGGDNFIAVTKGTVRVGPGQGGDYTFYVRSDDGFGMRILSQPTGGALTQHKFREVSVGGIDEDGSLVFMAPTGDSNTRGVINLPEGTYDVEFLMYENGGGAFYEVSTAKGNFISGSEQVAPQYVLLGDGRSVPARGGAVQAARLNGNATVTTHDIPVAGLLIADTISTFRANPTPVQTLSVDETILYDGDDICCGRPGATLATSQLNEFPNAGNDNFMTRMNGSFTVLDTDGAAGEMLTFGLFADDNTALHINGQSFTEAGGDANAMILNPESTGSDQWLVMDVRTGNSNAFGLISLTEGNYNFEAFQMEEGGDSGLEVWVAPGNKVGAFDNTFVPLSTYAPFAAAANQGLALVAGPGTGPSGPTGQTGDYNGNGVVDAADYVLWRNGGTLQNDPTPGVQPGDYDVWRANFGRTPGSGAAAASGVPEATTLLSAVVAMLCGFVTTRGRRS